jgi:hypothetical protein
VPFVTEGSLYRWNLRKIQHLMTLIKSTFFHEVQQIYTRRACGVGGWNRKEKQCCGGVLRHLKPRVFFVKMYPLVPWFMAKTVLHIDSKSRRNSNRFSLCRIARSHNSALCGIARSRFSASNRIELLRQFESIFKPALAHESGDPGVPFKEKTEGRKSCETVPLT